MSQRDHRASSPQATAERDRRRQGPVCIAGMHRSGTSAITRLLNLNGMFLGPSERLMPASHDNPEGFWENLDFVELNDEILTAFGGAWDLAPKFGKGWESIAKANTLRNKANKILKAFEECPRWGWKDPRNSLTYPFWKGLLPNVKVIVCLRDPLAVAQSLRKRNGHSIHFGLNLWYEYNRSLWRHLAAEPGKQQWLITHYDTYFYDPVLELQRILHWLDWEIDENRFLDSLRVIQAHLRHHAPHRRDQPESGGEKINRSLWKKALNVYQRMCQEAGASFHAMVNTPPGTKVFMSLNESLPRDPQKTGTSKLHIDQGTASDNGKDPRNQAAPKLATCPDPIFVVGCPRSGTSVMAHSLAKHSSAWVGPESNFLTPIAKAALEAYGLGTQRGAHHWLSNQNVSQPEFMSAVGEGINALFTRHAAGKRWIEQTPEYTMHLEQMGLLFPGAYFVHIVRDGRDVVNSMLHSGFAQRWAEDFGFACRTWAGFVLESLKYEIIHPQRMKRVYNERLSSAPQAELEELLNFLSLPFEESTLEFFKNDKRINSSFARSNNGKANWRDSWTAEQRRIFDNIAGKLLIALGYENDHSWVDAPHIASGDSMPQVRTANEILEDWNSRSKTDHAVVQRTMVSKSICGNGSMPARVSIVIPVFNQLNHTHRCIKSILKNTSHPDYEIIVVNNGSGDGTGEYLSKLNNHRIKVVDHEENLGFVKGCNSGAAAAAGKYVVFLNNDTEVQPGWLTHLVELAEERPDCGAVGCKLIYPDGILQEAGGIVFADGQGWNYGRGFDPHDPRFNFVREVDYCSAAALLVKKDLWDKLAGFDTRYSPAYYEDTDLCFGIRKLGYRVYYQPRSMVVHHEGKTAGNDLHSGTKKYQLINRGKFCQKWRSELAQQFPNNPDNVARASNRQAKKRILLIDPFLPLFDRASGSLRLFHILKILRQQEYHITFIARNGSMENIYRPILENMGIEVYTWDVEAMKAAGVQLPDIPQSINYPLLFKERQFDYAIIDFWETAEYYLPIIRKSSSRTKIIIDTVDVHFVRELREADLTGNKELREKARQNKTREIAVYQQADQLWVVTPEDQRAIAGEVANIPINVVPNIHKKIEISPKYENSADLLFVGNFNHPPNQDAIHYFCQQIFPDVLEKLPDVKLYIVGNNPPPQVQQLASENIIVTGYVEDLSPYLRQSRVSVNPLRFGAGMKGKIGEALSWGLPVVTTSIGAEGMGLLHEKHALIGDDPHTFAGEIIRLYSDKRLWETLSRNGKEFVEQNWSPEVIQKKLIAVFEDDKAPTTSSVAPAIHNGEKVSIIILTFNAMEETRKCIQSIQRYTHYPHEIIFVDNGSTDRTKQYLSETVQQNENYFLISNKTNLGFATGNNQGVRKARGKYICLLNNDVVVSGGWLESLVAALEMDERIGIVGPITNYSSGRQMVEKVPYSDEEGFHQFARKLRAQNHGKVTPRRRLAGFAVLMKKSLYEEIGGIDESFGAGNFEDDDLCLRVRQKGYALMVDEATFIHHEGSRTFKANKMDYTQSLQEKGSKFRDKWPEVDYEELLEIRNPLPEEHQRKLEEAAELLSRGSIQEARDIFDDVLTENPLSTDALLGSALCARRSGDNPMALKLLNKLIQLQPESALAYNQIGIIFAEMGDLETAKSFFVMAIQNDGAFIDAQRNYGEVLLELEDYQNGVQVFRKILENHPDDVSTLLYMAQLNAEVERKDEARTYVEKVLDIDAGNLAARRMYAELNGA